MNDRFPGYQNMIAFGTKEEVINHLNDCYRIRESTVNDCYITNLEDTFSYEKKQGLKTRYQLHWTTYRGWQTYMLMTGCFATDPRFETPTVGERSEP